MSNILTNRSPRRPSPSIENGKIGPPRRVANLERRSREHLTPTEVERLVKAAGKVGRHGPRDATLILIAYRHGLRVGELVGCCGEPRHGLAVQRTRRPSGYPSPRTSAPAWALRDSLSARPLVKTGGMKAKLLTHEVAHIADPGLRDALARLGAEVKAGR